MWSSTVRSIVTLILTLLVTLLAAEAQPPAKVARIGVLRLEASPSSPQAGAFRQGLKEYGYVEGQNIVLEERWAEGRPERPPARAAEWVRLPVVLIVAGNGRVARAARQATERLPIVLVYGDVVGTGLVTNIARPEGNITGLATSAVELTGKRLE